MLSLPRKFKAKATRDTPRQLLGEKRTREEVSFWRGRTVEQFFFKKGGG